jgi:heme oxygenase
MRRMAGSSGGLAATLRQATKSLHVEAERAGVMQPLLQGRLSLADYRRLLRNLRAIYAALEPALQRHREHACIKPVFFPDLFRSHALAADLIALGDAMDDPEAGLAPAAIAYGQRLRELDADDPALLAAHAYVRYLGDLSGGQVLARIVARSYGLQGEGGTGFYAFGPPQTVSAQAAALRSGLDAIPADRQGQERIVREAQRAFGLHRQLFEQLAAA